MRDFGEEFRRRARSFCYVGFRYLAHVSGAGQRVGKLYKGLSLGWPAKHALEERRTLQILLDHFRPGENLSTWYGREVMADYRAV